MNIDIGSSFSEVLKTFRKKKGMSQQVVANRLGVHFNTISKWERGICLPDAKGIVLELARQLHLDEQETRQLLESSLTALSPYWNIPYQRNPFFTGRQTFLQTLHDRLCSERSITLSRSYALSGLGGIGKTQSALEYAHQHALDYSAIFWITAETIETLYIGFATIAAQLQLPEREEKEVEKVVHAVLRWLNTHNEWLLIFDNVVSIALLKPFLPTARHGAILFTTQLHTLEDLSYILELPPFSSDEGVYFLLHRARLIDTIASLDDPLPPELAEPALILVEAVGGLPLALDQAGAYIERTGCRVIDYLHLFERHQISLLAERSEIAHHPTSVVKTFQLSFEQVMREDEAAADLLRLCAFLVPDAIPEELLTKGANSLGSQLGGIITESYRFNQTLEVALRYSLLDRHSQNQTLSMHRLVQTILQNTLTKAQRRIWAERAVRATNIMFPQQMDVTYLSQYRRYLPQVQVCHALIQDYALSFEGAASLLFRTANYLQFADTLYEQAEPLFLRALQIREQAPGSGQHDVAQVLNSLAELYVKQGKYEQAEPLFLRALQIQKQHTEPEHADMAQVLNSLAELYVKQGKYEQAEPLFHQALRIWEERLGLDHPRLGQALNNLTFLFREQGKYEQAEPLIRRALQIWEKHKGPDHPDIAFALKNLAVLFEKQGKYEQAEPLFLRALQIREQTLSPNHLSIASSLMGLASLYRKQGKDSQAEPLYERALQIRENRLITQHPDIAETLHDIANLREAQGRILEALPLYKRALAIQEQVFGPEHLFTATTRMNYVVLLHSLEQSDDTLQSENC